MVFGGLGSEVLSGPPNKSDENSEDGTNQGPDLVGLNGEVSEPGEEPAKREGTCPDAEDFSSVGAVAEVVSGGDITELSNKGHGTPSVSKVSNPSEGPVPSSVGVSGGGVTKIIPVAELPGDG